VSPDPRALVITGDGLNCERETAEALRLAGAVPELVHVSDVPERGLEDFRLLVLIGGFSNGDHLGAGTVQASLFRHRLRRPLERFLSEGRLVLGVCNGFQTLVKMGLLPGADWERTATIMANDSGRFEDRWVHLAVDPSSACVWTRGLRRHRRCGTGKAFVARDMPLPDPRRRAQVASDDAAGGQLWNIPRTLTARKTLWAYDPSGGFSASCRTRGLPLPVQPPLLDPDTGRCRRKEGLSLFRNAAAFLRSQARLVSGSLGQAAPAPAGGDTHERHGSTFAAAELPDRSFGCV
jgi:putative intracellular protease/amidase